MPKPNIVLFFSDQQRADTVGLYGQELDITPNLDRMGNEGIVFENAFTPQPVCGPFRSILQSGRYPTETGCFTNQICRKMAPCFGWRDGAEADYRLPVLCDSS